MPEKRDQSFSRLNRLSKASDFKRVFSKGRRIAVPQFVVYVFPNGLPVSRLGIQVRAKIGSSTRRNYIKRIVREIFRKNRGGLRESVDIIFIAQAPAVDLDYPQLEALFHQALRRFMSDARS